MTSPVKKSLRTVLIGCGQIADAHLQELVHVNQANVVAVCDTIQDLADQAAARFGISHVYSHVSRMLSEQKPDVVHITTPVQTHAVLAEQSLQAGCHVYIEKPMAVDVDEADRVISLARKVNRTICLGHDQLFDPIWQEACRRIENGAIGTVRHVESTLGYPIGGPFGRSVTSDPHHWVHRLPGGLFQNTISHPLYRITEFLRDERPEIIARWSGREHGFPTELFVWIQGAEVTGQLTFLSRIAAQRITRLVGEQGALTIDFDGQTIRQEAPPKMPGAFGKLELPFRQWREGARNLRRNVWRFIRSDIHYFAGMRELFRRFYDSLIEGGDPPISTAEMRRVTWIMDEIFRQCRQAEKAVTSTTPVDQEAEVSMGPSESGVRKQQSPRYLTSRF